MANKKRSVTNKELTKKQLKVSYLTLLVTFIGIIITIFLYTIDIYREKYQISHPSYEYNISMDWKNLEQLDSYSNGQEQIVIYDKGSTNPDGAYTTGVSLITHYTNYDKNDRAITKLNIYANNIVRDNSPKLAVFFSDDYPNNLTAKIFNMGWGASGKVQLNVLSIGGYDNNQLQIRLRESAARSIIVDELVPGDSKYVDLFSVDDFEITWSKDSNDHSTQFLYMILQLIDLETGTSYEYTAPFCVYYENKIGPYPESQGGEYPQKNYVVMVDTSSQTWHKSFDVEIILPSEKITRIPIIVFPDQSCTMDIRIELVTSDGAVIGLTPLENSRFFVSYFASYDEYIEGDIINWDELDGMEIMYFPVEP